MIVISAANESEIVERALKLGATNYLLKPCSHSTTSLAGCLSTDPNVSVGCGRWSVTKPR